jgi:crotonobetainyl-CoA:carnitine CoA-transferase CaiB-like acyl-CoA transferase
MNERPLDGVRVVDFTHDWVGPFSTRILGDFGAEVIKVEYARRMCAFRGGYLENQMYNRHPRWHQMNRNKRSVTLDLHVPEDRQAFEDLLGKSDILVSNSRPQVLEKFGLSYPHLRKLKPDLIVVSLSAFGATGPYATFAGYGATIEPMSGLNELTAYEKSGQRYRLKEMDVFNGLMAASAIMTALMSRQRTGQGQYVDLSQMEAAIHGLMGEHLLEYIMNGTQTLPVGNRHRGYAPQGCYRCKGHDKWVVMTIRTDEEWKKLCDLMGRSQWASDVRYKTVDGRFERHDELDRGIEEWTIQHTHYEVMEMLQQRGLPAGAVLDVSELCQDQHLKEKEYFISTSHGAKGLFPGLPFRLSRGVGGMLRKGPDLGQDNEYVLCDILGRSRQDLKPLQDSEIGTAYDPE